MAGQIFISAASADRHAAEKLCAGIEAAGLSCWIASRDIAPGLSYSRSILEAIAASRVMLVVLSSKTSDSSHVLREVERAVDRRLPLMPVRVEDARPRDELEYFLSAVQWVDAFPDLADDVLRRIVGSLRALVGAEPEPTSALVPDVETAIVGPIAAIVPELIPESIPESVLPNTLIPPNRNILRRVTYAGIALALLLGVGMRWDNKRGPVEPANSEAVPELDAAPAWLIPLDGLRNGISREVPDQLQLTNITQKEDVVTIHGRAINNIALVAFVVNLRNSQYFKRSEIVSTTAGTGAQGEFVEFVLKVVLVPSSDD